MVVGDFEDHNSVKTEVCLLNGYYFVFKAGIMVQQGMSHTDIVRYLCHVLQNKFHVVKKESNPDGTPLRNR